MPHGADADQKRVGRVSKFLARLVFDLHEGGLNLGLDGLGKRTVGRVIVVADLGGDGEPRGHGNADRAHLREVRAFAAE